MRLPIPKGLEQRLAGATVTAVRRRGKYLLFDCTPVDGKTGSLIIHLGMSGRLWLVDANTPPEKPNHFDLVFDNSRVIRLRDPRRFGLVLWQTGDPLTHPLLAAIGPEPLTADFDGAVLYRETRKRSAAIKLVIMDSHVVSGVGNIYANEALFRWHRSAHAGTARQPQTLRCAGAGNQGNAGRGHQGRGKFAARLRRQ